MADYTTPDELARQLGLSTPVQPGTAVGTRLTVACTAASDAIDYALGRVDTATPVPVGQPPNPVRFDPVPAGIGAIALSVCVDWWKQPDATFGIVGMNETGPVRIGRDLISRYWPQLIPYGDRERWGIA